MKCRTCSKNVDDHLPRSFSAFFRGLCRECEKKELSKSAKEIESQEVTE
jgi:hypothetical protein